MCLAVVAAGAATASLSACSGGSEMRPAAATSPVPLAASTEKLATDQLAALLTQLKTAGQGPLAASSKRAAADLAALRELLGQADGIVRTLRSLAAGSPRDCRQITTGGRKAAKVAAQAQSLIVALPRDVAALRDTIDRTSSEVTALLRQSDAARIDTSTSSVELGTFTTLTRVFELTASDARKTAAAIPAQLASLTHSAASLTYAQLLAKQLCGAGSAGGAGQPNSGDANSVVDLTGPLSQAVSGLQTGAPSSGTTVFVARPAGTPTNAPTTNPPTTKPPTPPTVPPTTTPPTTTDPGTDPGTTDPGTTDPGTNPGTTDPGTNPGTTDPGTNPGTTDPGTNPGTTDPGTTDPGTNPGTTDPGTTGPRNDRPWNDEPPAGDPVAVRLGPVTRVRRRCPRRAARAPHGSC